MRIALNRLLLMEVRLCRGLTGKAIDSLKGDLLTRLEINSLGAEKLALGKDPFQSTRVKMISRMVRFKTGQ